MTLNEYQKLSERTCAPLGDIRMDLSHMILGMVSELNELHDANINDDVTNQSEELADLWWYIANYCTFRGYNLEELYRNTTNTGFNLEYNISKLADIVKKHIAYNKEIDIDKERQILYDIIDSLDTIYKSLNINITKSLENNINKLKIRFPNRFNENHALNRNIELERKELEK